MNDATNEPVVGPAAGTDGASLENQHHTNSQVLNDGKKIEEIRIHLIKTEGTQTRVAGLNQETIDSYAEDMTAGASFPPLVVYFDGTDFFLGDGAHRLAAAKQIGCNYIKCEVRPGGQRDALRWSLQANKSHGLKRSNDDKRHAVKLVLADAEWGKLSARAIADMCGVTAPTVASVIEELAASAGDSDSTVKVLQLNPSKRLGADGKWRPATKPQSTPQVSEVSKADDDTESDEGLESENLESEELDTSKLEAAGLSKEQAAVIVAAKSKNGKPVIDALLIQKTLKNLSELGRQLWELGLFKKHDANMSAVLRDVNELGGRKPVPIKATGIQSPAPANQSQVVDEPPF